MQQELKDLPQKNLAVELLKKLLKEEVKKRTKINLVESKKFSASTRPGNDTLG